MVAVICGNRMERERERERKKGRNEGKARKGNERMRKKKKKQKKKKKMNDYHSIECQKSIFSLRMHNVFVRGEIHTPSEYLLFCESRVRYLFV